MYTCVCCCTIIFIHTQVSYFVFLLPACTGCEAVTSTGTPVEKTEINPFTVSEVLRLYLVNSSQQCVHSVSDCVCVCVCVCVRSEVRGLLPPQGYNNMQCSYRGLPHPPQLFISLLRVLLVSSLDRQCAGDPPAAVSPPV